MTLTTEGNLSSLEHSVEEQNFKPCKRNIKNIMTCSPNSDYNPLEGIKYAK